MRQFPNRQIHLDFHTSPCIPAIGEAFDVDTFGKTLADAQVEHINLFGKCHHGWFYYPSKIGQMHPHLAQNLLGGQIEACKKYGISFSIYTCVGWNEQWATLHPQWQEISPEGVLGNKPPFERRNYQWQKLCLNNKEYQAVIKAELKEEYERFAPLGFWIDIILQNECVCPSCKNAALHYGMDIHSAQDRQKLARLAQIDFMREIGTFVQSLNQTLHVYFNGYAYAYDLKDEPMLSNANKRETVTYMDIESLPSSEWGYTHFPIAANYVNKYDGLDVTMMNGKFHLAWGDFGTLRNIAAMEYECFRAQANGAGVCVGDQLHPNGLLDKTVYQRIGKVFSQMKEVEPWCLNTKKIAQIGVFGTIRSAQMNQVGGDSALEGAYRLLTEQKYQYDVLDVEDSIDGYELLILPDSVVLTTEAASRIDAYVANGGKLLLTAFSGLNQQQDGFMLESIPVVYQGQAETAPRYIDVDKGTFESIEPMTYVCYSRGAKVIAKPNATVLCQSIDSYFDRTEEHFCSHRQTPNKPVGNQEPAIVLQGGTAYVSNPLFSDISEYGVKVYKDILCDLIKRLVKRPLVKAELPTFVEVTLRKNMDHSTPSTIVHMLTYIIQRKCKQLDTIEEYATIYQPKMQIRVEHKPLSVRIIPQQKDISFSYEDGYVMFQPPCVCGRLMLEIK